MDGLKKSKIVSVDRTRSDKASPIIATFQNANITSENCKQTVCKRVQTEKDGRKFALIATDSNVYKADITDESEHVDTYIAVHNKDTREINLIQVQTASFKHVLYDNKRTAFEQNIVDSRKVLQKEFGGKNAINAYDRNQKTQINSKILEDTVDKMLDSVDTEKIFEKDDQQEDVKDKPLQSIYPELSAVAIEGKSVRDIFTLNVLLGSDILEHLKEFSLETLKKDPKELNIANRHLRSVVDAIRASKLPESDENLKQMGMVIYAEMLIAVIGDRRSLFEPNKILKHISVRLQQHLMRNFFVHGSKENSTFTRQRAIIFYTILVLLTTKSLEIDINDLLDGVKLSKRELIKYVVIIGCKTKGEQLYLHKVANINKDSNFATPVSKKTGPRRK